MKRSDINIQLQLASVYHFFVERKVKMAKNYQAPAQIGAKGEWKRFFMLGFVGLPIAILLAVCAYGFIVWFMQILFWGPPN